jgi:hypothetical protein
MLKQNIDTVLGYKFLAQVKTPSQEKYISQSQICIYSSKNYVFDLCLLFITLEGVFYND